MTVITGPPGSGKTVMLCGWAWHAAPGAVVWIGLEEADNDPAAFRAHLEHASRDADGRLREVLLNPFENRPDWRSLPGLPNTPASAARAVVIVDDLHLITNGAVIEWLEALADHMPENVHLIVSSRERPDFTTGARKLKAVREINEADLRFTVAEAGGLLTSVSSYPVTLHDVRDFVDRTEGWAAGLRLVALMLAESASAPALTGRFTGDVDMIADYFAHEVMASEPEETLQFLVETSVFDEMTASGCRAVTGRPDAETILDTLVARHLFITRHDAREPTYRYHPLFLEYLRSRRRRESKGIQPDAYLRAASWLEKHHDIQGAIRQLNEHGDYERAFGLVVPNIVQRLDDSVPFDSSGELSVVMPLQYAHQTGSCPVSSRRIFSATSTWAKQRVGFAPSIPPRTATGTINRSISRQKCSGCSTMGYPSTRSAYIGTISAQRRSLRLLGPVEVRLPRPMRPYPGRLPSSTGRWRPRPNGSSRLRTYGLARPLRPSTCTTFEAAPPMRQTWCQHCRSRHMPHLKKGDCATQYALPKPQSRPLKA